MNAPFAFEPIRQPTPFRSLTAMRDVVLTAEPPGPLKLAQMTPGERTKHALLTRGIAAWREGRGFVFPDFTVDSDAFHDLSNASTDAFAEGVIGLPYPTFCGIAGLSLHGETRLALVIAEEVDNLVDIHCLDLGEGWRVHAVVPHGWPECGSPVYFDPISRAVSFFAEGGTTYGRPVEPPAEGFESEASEIPIRTLFVMLAALADRRVEVQRVVPDHKLNLARGKRGKPPIPASWRVTDSSAAYVTTIAPAKPHGEGRGGHHRSPTPHSRRGHQRRLRSGRTVWVRSSMIGRFIKHLTRNRKFYQVEGV